jgi:hypothetical protein
MKRHRTDVVSLVFGLIFLGIVGWWSLGRGLDFQLPAVGWVIALALLVVGAFGLFGALRGRDGGRDERIGS